MPAYTITLDAETVRKARMAAAMTGHNALSRFIPQAVAAYAAQVLDQGAEAPAGPLTPPQHP